MSLLYGGEKRALRAGLDQLSNKLNSNLDINSNIYLYISIHTTLILLFNLLVIILSSLLYSLIFNLLVFSLSGVIYIVLIY